MSRDHDEDRPEREKRSWREIDRMRDRSRSSSERQPRTPVQQARAAAASKQYLKHLDGLFSKDQGDSEGQRLAKAVRDAHGTPGLADACRAYREALALPDDPSLLSLFLDTGDPELMCSALEALRAAQCAGNLEASRGLRTQLRILAEGSNDAVAEAAEGLLDAL